MRNLASLTAVLALTFAGLFAFGCKKPDPQEDCRRACQKVTDCNLQHLAEAMDCANGCQTLKTFPECPSCLAGSSTTCEGIATARSCGASCRVR